MNVKEKLRGIRREKKLYFIHPTITTRGYDYFEITGFIGKDICVGHYRVNLITALSKIYIQDCLGNYIPIFKDEELIYNHKISLIEVDPRYITPGMVTSLGKVVLSKPEKRVENSGTINSKTYEVIKILHTGEEGPWVEEIDILHETVYSYIP